MSRVTKQSAGPITMDNVRIQPGRVMIILRNAMVTNDVVMDIAMQYGPIRDLHRSVSNNQHVFVQYENPECAILALEKLRRYPIFQAVDPALKSERFSNTDANPQKNQNKNQFHKYQNHNSDTKTVHQDGGRSDFSGNNNSIGSENGDRSYTSPDTESSPNPAVLDFYQPEYPLGCWNCTKMPSFECQCGAFYCDNNCQRADWARHKQYCMPRLVPISYSNKRILQEATSKQNTSVPSSQFSQPQQQKANDNRPKNTSGQQQQQQQQQPKQQQQSKQPKQQQQQQFKQPQQNQNRNKNYQQKQEQNRSFESQSQPKEEKIDKDSSSVDDNASKVSQLSNRLQRMKLKSAVNGGGGNVCRVLEAGRFPSEGSNVRITACLPSGVVYICESTGEKGPQTEYQILAARVFKEASKAQPLTEMPAVDDVVFANFMGDYYRAKVLSIKAGEKLEVQYPDFGNIDTVSWKDCRTIADEEVKWAKYLAFPTKLEGVGTLTSEMQKLMETVVWEEFGLAAVNSIKASTMKEVVLKRPNQSLTLNMELVELGERERRARQAREEQQKERERREKEQQAQKKNELQVADPKTYKPILFDEYMETKQLPLESQQQLIIIDASELLEMEIISVIMAKDAQQYALAVQDCEAYGLADPNPYRPTEEGEVCLACYEGGWSRALYDISDNRYMLLDIGIIVSIAPANIRRFPPGLSRVVYNNEVIVENLTPLKQKMENGKPETLQGKTVESWVNKTDDGTSIRVLAVK